MAEPNYQYLGELVTLAKTGNNDAFAELYLATYQKQYKFACQYLKDPDLAQDALQQTYVLALQRLSSLKDPNLFISWLNQINFRVCFHMQKKNQMFSTEYDEDALERIPDQKKDPETQILEVDQKKYLIRQIMSLPSSESQALILHYYNNMRVEDIAKLMDISRSSVIRYMNSGRKKLRKLLE